MSQDPLDTPIQYAKGVGPSRAELLERLNMLTVRDLLWTLPRDLIDLTTVSQPADLTGEKIESVRGEIVDVDARLISGGRTMTAALVQCHGGSVRGLWFNQPWMRKRLLEGGQVLLSGKPKFRDGRWEFSHPNLQWLEEDVEDANGGLLPKYGLTDGISQFEMRRMFASVVEDYVHSAKELLPSDLRERASLAEIQTALLGIHKPESLEHFQAGRRRLIFEEFLYFAVAVAIRRRAWNKVGVTPVLEVNAKIDSRIRRLFPFEFTDGQNHAIDEICNDLKTNRPMHRLLQADVGAGKTVVAIYAMLVAIANGCQAVLMAPTELLAIQHWNTIDSLLHESRVSRILLTGRLTPAERKATHEKIRTGETQLIIGTQAVIQKDVDYANVGVVVIDEQHKFGVEQRATFSAGSVSPHVLVMTATPIPRSLCLTLYGDLNLTLIQELPPGRQPVSTSLVYSQQSKQRAWTFIKKHLADGRQLYVVCPRIEDGDDSRVQGAEAIYNEMANHALRDFSVGLVHGRMPKEDQEQVMQRFRDHDLDVLVATTVIEVGVDIPNATMMLILNAERFGLSQLHQLRGRIGRGKFKGYCFLVTDPANEEAVERLHVLEMTADGFQVAEEDFERRGPGDVLGTRQHGRQSFRSANLVKDRELLEEAHQLATEIVDSGRIDEPDYHALKIEVLKSYGKTLDLPRTG